MVTVFRYYQLIALLFPTNIVFYSLFNKGTGKNLFVLNHNHLTRYRISRELIKELRMDSTINVTVHQLPDNVIIPIPVIGNVEKANLPHTSSAIKTNGITSTIKTNGITSTLKTNDTSISLYSVHIHDRYLDKNLLYPDFHLFDCFNNFGTHAIYCIFKLNNFFLDNHHYIVPFREWEWEGALKFDNDLKQISLPKPSMLDDSLTLVLQFDSNITMLPTVQLTLKAFARNGSLVWPEQNPEKEVQLRNIYNMNQFSNTRKLFLTACTSVSASDLNDETSLTDDFIKRRAESIVRWTWYHLSTGFEHILIYLDFKESRLSSILLQLFAKDMSEGIVTLILAHPLSTKRFQVSKLIALCYVFLQSYI